MKPARRRALRRLAALPVCVGLAPLARRAGAATPGCRPWAAWDDFARHFIDAGGRVVEFADARQRTVSEAQGYAMFFALVANQRELFQRLLRWTEDNLAGGDLTQRLPAWHWGRRDDGSWGIVDDNAASDADLWIAYALGEAARLWGVRHYATMARLLAERVLREATADLPGLGPTLLPGPRGFALAPARWRLNPSYLAPMQLRWLATQFGGRWAAVHEAALKLLRDSAPHGLAPDWAVYDGGARRLERREPLGSYDAIRVYLWLGLSATAGADPALEALLAHCAPMAAATEASGAPPARVDALDGSFSGVGSPGFSAALLPFLQALGRPDALRRQLLRVQGIVPPADAYYERVLTLFGLGAHEGRFAFDADGRLVPGWAACVPSPPSRGARL
ncbi:MAG: cellulase [Leptothrix sp. (in: Bacteria)]|nr:cellulase [Leptothrix sp. (in: b-proteobacteria)]